MTPLPSITVAPAGALPDGRQVTAYTLNSGNGLRLTALDLGGIVTAIETPDRHGNSCNVVLSLERLADYVARQRNFGALVGRCANRIAQASFELDGETWNLDANECGNTVHGGPTGFAMRLWSVAAGPRDAQSVSMVLRLVSEHMDCGFPGRLDVEVRYTVSTDHGWRIDYRAHTDRVTVANLTHHAYFNLAGGGTALDHVLSIAASRYLQVDARLLPLQPAPVAGTPFDFRATQSIAAAVRRSDPQLARARGFDHTWILDRGDATGLVHAATLKDPASGRFMTVDTTEPGLQFYTGNFLDGSVRGARALIRQGDGVCLETQHFPNSPRRPDFPPVTLRPGETFASTTVYRFGAV